MLKRLSVFATLVVLTMPAAGQPIVIEIEDGPRRHFHAGSSPGNGTVRRFNTDQEAQKIVDQIRGFLPIRETVYAFVTDDAKAVPNAEARFDRNDRRVVGFNRAYMQNLLKESGTYWAMVGIAAHEVGHHVGNHTSLPDECNLNEKLELDADFQAGFALGKMSVKLDDAVSTLRMLPTTGVTCSHPGRLQRIAVLKEGWQKAATATTPLTVEAAATAVATVRAAAAVTPQSSFKLRSSRDVYGHDIEKLPGVSIDACAAKCEANPRCKGFSFDRWNGWCFLKDAMTESYMEPRSVIGVRSNVPFPNVSKAPTEMHRLRNKRFIDPPSETVSLSSYELCSEACAAKSVCVAFGYNKTTLACGLHREVKGYTFDATHNGGYKQQLSSGSTDPTTERMALTRDSFFEGDGYKREEDVSLETCNSRCLGATRCVAMEYMEKERICRLYDTAETAKPAPGTHVAFKRQ